MKLVTTRPNFQGDLMIRRIDAIPPNVRKVSPEDNGVHIVAHSEDGHHHVVSATTAERFIDETNSFIAYLKVSDDTVLEHLRGFDVHEAHLLQTGYFELTNQRELDMFAEIRRAQD